MKGSKEIKVTPEIVQEIMKCMRDYAYCCKNYIKVRHPTKGVVSFDLYDYQKRLLSTYENNDQVIVLASRQLGKTEVSAAYCLLKTIFNDNFTTLVVSYQQSGAIEILDRIKFMYEEMPDWLKPGVTVWNRTSVEFDNGSKIVARATTKNAGRGLSVSLLYADEFAIIPTNIVEEFWEAIYPVLSTGGECIITSTPKGDNNRFYYIWRDAYILKKQDCPFTPIFLHWSEHPERDEKWANKVRQSLGDESKWQQEYECSFLSNAETVIELDLINDMMKQVRGKIEPPYSLSDPGWEVWIPRQKDHEYFMFIDVSEGNGGDYHVINIFDDKLRQCAMFRDNSISIDKLAEQIYKSSSYYYDASIFLEINGPGMAVIPYLTKVYEIPERLKKEKPSARDYGFRMTASRRNEGIAQMKHFLPTGRVEINSIDLLNELRTFKRRDGRRRYEAEQGCHDDIAMTLVMMFSLIKRLSSMNETVWETLYGEQHEPGKDDDPIDSLDPVPPIGTGMSMTDEWLLS